MLKKFWHKIINKNKKYLKKLKLIKPGFNHLTRDKNNYLLEIFKIFSVIKFFKL